METKRCPHCGETLPITSTFCPACFKELVMEPADSVIVSKKRPMFFLWLGILAMIVLFFTIMLVFSRNDRESNGIPATFTPPPFAEDTASVISFVPEFTSDTTVPSTVNTATQFEESVTPSLSLQTPTFSTFTTATGTFSAVTTATASTPTQLVTGFGHTTSTLTVPSTTLARKPTQTRVTATATASKATSTIKKTAKPTTTIKPTTTVKPTNTVTPTATTTPAIDNSHFSYTVSGGKATINKYTGSDAVVYIPETLGGYPVTQIGDEAFSNQNTLLEVYLPDTIVEIGIHAFSFCYNLHKVQLSENLKKISDNAFYCCVNLSAISLPDTLEYMGPGSFTESGLDEIKIPAAVTQLEAALYSMHYLDYIEVEKGNPKYWSQDGVLFQNIDDGTSMLLKYPAEKEGRSYTIPDNVSIIDGEAFRGNQSLETLTFSKQLTTVYSNAFFMCSSLTTVKTYGNLQTVYYGAFYRCTNLTSINLESSVTYIGEDVFAYCDNPILTVTKGSYAHTYAKENNIPYILK